MAACLTPHVPDDWLWVLQERTSTRGIAGAMPRAVKRRPRRQSSQMGSTSKQKHVGEPCATASAVVSSSAKPTLDQRLRRMRDPAVRRTFALSNLNAAKARQLARKGGVVDAHPLLLDASGK